MTATLDTLIAQADDAADALSAGYFMHAKGGLYVVNHVAVCSETKELRVVYSEVKPDGFRVPGVPSWDRPYSMWNELVEAPSGRVVPRFERIAPLRNKSLTIETMRRDRLGRAQ